MKFKCDRRKLTKCLKNAVSQGKPECEEIPDSSGYYSDSNVFLAEKIEKTNLLFAEEFQRLRPFFVNGYWVGKFVDSTQLYTQLGPD